jgi:glycosyltransferase involved in cell wall biosynthesis
MSPFISAVICTHNPRSDYLEKVLRALEQQTLPQQKWELIIVDNASDQDLASHLDLSWHPRARIIREEQLGNIWARVRGIREAAGELILYVDDDNVLDVDYLETSLQIALQYPMLGVWGAGVIRGNFEIEPPASIVPYLGNIAVFTNHQDAWSNASHDNHALPVGAGMSLRKQVGKRYADEMQGKEERKFLGRKGSRLTSCEDEDIAMAACSLGLGTARLTALRLTHLIPKERLTEDYFIRLQRGYGYSKVMLNHVRNLPNYKRSPLRVLLDRYRSRHKDLFTQKLETAWRQGEADAWTDITKLQQDNNRADR